LEWMGMGLGVRVGREVEYDMHRKLTAYLRFLCVC
jgi:hypothetical protein